MINFPAILLNKHGAGAVSDESKFTTCGEEWAINGGMIGTKVISNTGDMFIIREATIVKNKNLLPRWMVSSSRRIAKVKYKLDFERKIELQEAKKLILKEARTLSKDEIDDIRGSITFNELSASVGLD